MNQNFKDICPRHNYLCRIDRASQNKKLPRQTKTAWHLVWSARHQAGRTEKAVFNQISNWYLSKYLMGINDRHNVGYEHDFKRKNKA